MVTDNIYKLECGHITTARQVIMSADMQHLEAVRKGTAVLLKADDPVKVEWFESIYPVKQTQPTDWDKEHFYAD